MCVMLDSGHHHVQFVPLFSQGDDSVTVLYRAGLVFTGVPLPSI